MIPTRLPILKAVATLLLGAIPCLAQTQPQPQPAAPTLPKPAPAFYRNVVLIDPAHGGADTGAHLPNNIIEKNVTLSFSARLRTLLAAAGFAVISTRDSDPPDILTTDQRASQANHARPLACIILHASTSGSGVHIVTSALTPSDVPATPRTAPFWQAAQASAIPLSSQLANQINQTLASAKLPAVILRASVPPIDNLICPAVIIELSPLSPTGAQPTPVTDGSYQQQVAQAIADAVSTFRDINAPPPPASPAPAPAPTPAPGAEK